ncbi:MAG TPA: MFS transporter [Lautropia sp.]|nr:MFS transporter [Lautropia sp.]
MQTLRFQMGVLATLQALLLTNNVTLIAISGLAGLALAEDKALATLPVTGYVLGAAASSMLAARLMRRLGRRYGYSVGALLGCAGALLAAWAVSVGSLWMLAAATFVTGVYNAFGASYRFAAADVADAYQPGFRARAISLVLAGGIVGGIVGPEVSKVTREMLPATYAGSYLALAGFAILSLLLAQLLRLPRAADTLTPGPSRPLLQILRQPRCWVAVLTAAGAYGIMNLLMVATPLAMELCTHPFAATALVLQWHVIGMFLPGLFTGVLITRFGVLPIILAGCLLMFACSAVALRGEEISHFVIALTLLGVGWNFAYTGATTLLTQSYQATEKTRVQGFNDMVVFVTMITSSASSGVLLNSNGWALLNYLSIPFVALVMMSIVWLAVRREVIPMKV